MPDTLLQILADGALHSGQEIAEQLGISRAAVWKQVRKLESRGLEVTALPGRGYRLRHALELLQHDRIMAALEPGYQALLQLEVHSSLPSTSDYLKARLDDRSWRGSAVDGPALACFAEFQSRGRGRRGRRWFAPYAGALCFSVLWRYESSPMSLNGLSLALGAEIVSRLRKSGVEAAGLKWPNDIYWQGRKLGGILFEILGEESGPCFAIVGIGLNYRITPGTAQQIDQDWIDLAQIGAATAMRLPARNLLAAQLLGAVCSVMQDFDSTRLAAYLERWRSLDCCLGRRVCVTMPQARIEGLARGVDEHGRLLLETGGGLRCFASGEVSLRVKA